MTIALSVSDITKQILAQTAMRHILHKERPALLTADNTPAIACMARNAFGLVCLSLIPNISDCTINSDDDEDLMSLNIGVPSGTNIIALRLTIEHAICSYILAEAYSGVDEDIYSVYMEQYMTAIDSLRYFCNMPDNNVTIIPAWL